MHGTYTSPERVERGGVLVAFEGETMTMAEAERRGLKAEPKPEPKPEPKAEPKGKAAK